MINDRAVYCCFYIMHDYVISVLVKIPMVYDM